jgi:hypothetical protein
VVGAGATGAEPPVSAENAEGALITKSRAATKIFISKD